MPPVHSKISSSKPSSTKKAVITSKEKARLLQKARRLRKGALNSYLDPRETGTAGANFVDRATGEYDAWDPEGFDSDEEDLKKKVPKTKEGEEYVMPIVKKSKVKVSETLDCLRTTYTV